MKGRGSAVGEAPDAGTGAGGGRPGYTDTGCGVDDGGRAGTGLGGVERTDSEYPEGRCVHELFEEQVKKRLGRGRWYGDRS